MSEHFIKEIEIKNFKCFNDFKASGFGRVNLIGGKNNVGKTAFMEAMYINLNSDELDTFSTAIIKVSTWRNMGFIGEELGNLFNDFTNIFSNIRKYTKIKNLDKLFLKKIRELHIKTNFYDCYFKDDNDNLYFESNFFKKRINLSSLEFNNKVKNNIFFNTSSHLIVNNKLYDGYTILQKIDRESILDKKLSSFDNNIERIKFINKIPYIKLVDKKDLIELSEFGDGLKKYLTILIDILICTKGIIFIDEIENGIHYSKLDDFWGIILIVSKAENIQVFATTHSKECIESYARVAKKLEDEDITFIELGKNNNEITSIVYEYNEIINQVEQHQDIRGW